MSINIEVNGGKSVRLKTAGKYCDRDIVVTAKGGASGENKLAQVADKTVTEITAEDLAGATNIGQYTFTHCKKLISVSIPDGVTYIDTYAFQYCTAMKCVNITDNVTRIYRGAFRYTGLETVTIGNGITILNSEVFQACSALRSVTIKAVKPPSIQSDTFKDVPADCAFYVPPTSVEAYKSATNWSARADYIFPILDGAQKGDLIWSATTTGGKISWDSSIFEFNKVYFVENSAFNVYSEYSEPYPRIGTTFTAIDGKEYEIYYVTYGEVWLKTTDGSEVTENLVVNFYSSKE